MLKKNLKVLTAIFLIALITFSSITLLAKVGRALKLDLTEDRIYSLSDETRKIIGGLNHPVRLKLFFSRTRPSRVSTPCGRTTTISSTSATSSGSTRPAPRGRSASRSSTPGGTPGGAGSPPVRSAADPHGG